MADIPEIILDRYRLHELPQAEADRIERLVAADATLRARLLAMDRSDQEINDAYPPAQIASAVRDRVAVKRRVTRPLRSGFVGEWIAPAACLAAAIVLVVSMPRRAEDSMAPAASGTIGAVDTGDRIKRGGPALSIFRNTPHGSQPLADGDAARAGDLIRLGYTAAGRSFGVIVSVDGWGAVTTHLPANGAQAARLKTEARVLLDQAYELDAAPRWEQFYFITESRPFDVSQIVEAARQVGASGTASPPALLPLPKHFDQTAFLLQKETGR